MPSVYAISVFLFQHTAARRRLQDFLNKDPKKFTVSTHSRPKAAGATTIPLKAPTRFQHTAARRRLGCKNHTLPQNSEVSTHSRPKAAGIADRLDTLSLSVSTHSRPKAAGFSYSCYLLRIVCFNTQPPEGGWTLLITPLI